MYQYLYTLYLDRERVLKIWALATVAFSPFPLIKTIAEFGFNLDEFVYRLIYVFNYSIFFSTLFTLTVIILNFVRLRERKRVFDAPAFMALDFHGRIDGFGSMLKELETFLVGKINPYLFRINVIVPEDDHEPEGALVEIIPMIAVEDGMEVVDVLKSQHGFGEYVHWSNTNDIFKYLGKRVQLSEADLMDRTSLRTILREMVNMLVNLEIDPIHPKGVDMS